MDLKIYLQFVLQGERIFRIGSLRYKMDSSRRTLQRISGGPLLIHSLFILLVIYYVGCLIAWANATKLVSNKWRKWFVDDESSSGALQKEKDDKKMYIPRRLMIGKDEYVFGFVAAEYL